MSRRFVGFKGRPGAYVLVGLNWTGALVLFKDCVTVDEAHVRGQEALDANAGVQNISRNKINVLKIVDDAEIIVESLNSSSGLIRQGK